MFSIVPRSPWNQQSQAVKPGHSGMGTLIREEVVQPLSKEGTLCPL